MVHFTNKYRSNQGTLDSGGDNFFGEPQMMQLLVMLFTFYGQFVSGPEVSSISH